MLAVFIFVVSCCLAQGVFSFGCPKKDWLPQITVDWQHRLLAALKVGYFALQQHEALQWFPISQILGLHVWDRNEQDLFVIFKPEELPRIPFTIPSVVPGAQKVLWSAHKFFRVTATVSLGSRDPETFSITYARLLGTPHMYQDACEVWFVPAKQEAFVALLVLQRKGFVPPAPL